MKKITVGIIGLGRFGSLVVQILSDKFKNVEIKVFTRSEKHLKRNCNFSFVSLEEAAGCDVVIPCVPVSEFEGIIRDIRDHLQTGALLFEVCTVKTHSVKIMERILPKNINIVASHPLFGPDSAKNGLKSLKIVLWKVRISDKKFEKIKEFCENLGLQVLEMSPEKHDKLLAFSQGFAHLIGRVMEHANINSTPINTASFNQLLRVKQFVVNDSFQLFNDMHQFNPFSKKMRRQVKKSLEDLEQSLIC